MQEQTIGLPFPILKTIRVCTHLRSAREARTVIIRSGVKIDDWAKLILNKVQFTGTYTSHEFDLVAVSGYDLGFTVQNVSRREIYDRAIECGLELCPPELAIWIRDQYSDQPMNEWLLVGMEPIADSAANLNVFIMGRNHDGLWLCSRHRRPGNDWPASNRWLFVLPRK